MKSKRTESTDPEAARQAAAEEYCAKHPRGPAAVRHPRILRRGDTFIALLGSTLEDGIAGLGNSVEAALRAFDVQYVARLHPPER